MCVVKMLQCFRTQVHADLLQLIYLKRDQRKHAHEEAKKNLNSEIIKGHILKFPKYPYYSGISSFSGIITLWFPYFWVEKSCTIHGPIHLSKIVIELF